MEMLDIDDALEESLRRMADVFRIVREGALYQQHGCGCVTKVSETAAAPHLILQAYGKGLEDILPVHGFSELFRSGSYALGHDGSRTLHLFTLPDRHLLVFQGKDFGDVRSAFENMYLSAGYTLEESFTP